MFIEDNICLMSDSYKMCHHSMYLPNTKYVYSYLEARTGAKYNKTVFYGLQYLLKKYLAGQIVTQEKIDQAEQIINQHLGPGKFNREGWEYILKKHNGKLPVSIKAVPEGTPVDISNVLMTVVNTDENCAWLTNYLETTLFHVWYSSTVATLSREIKILINHYLQLTKGDNEGIEFMLHDFGMRGATTDEAAAFAGSGHLINFRGTDTVPALMIPINYYNFKDIPGYSVAATEHSIMTSRAEVGEFDVVKNLFDKYPEGILAMVIDSYNFERFIETLGTKFHDIIMNRKGRVVFRPDSGEPNTTTLKCFELLNKHFGSRVNSKGYKVLDDHVRVLWGDGIDYDGIRGILYTLKLNGWSAENIIFGCGGGLVQKVNRDTQRMAFKCSAQYYDGQWHDVWKKPLDITKESKRGRLMLIQDENLNFKTIPYGEDMKDQDILWEVFRDGELLIDQTFENIRNNAQI